ncbi:MAG TPA: SRPBCC family protein [Pyrinomonadaceae bacterium]|jgi:hypothetical protein
MPINDYHFITHWRVEGTVEEVADVIENVSELPRWWPSVYLDVQILEAGDERGVGRLVSVYTKGWLPYTLRWQFRLTDSRYPLGSTIEALGDFVGRGIWTFEQVDQHVNITYDWRIRAAKPLLAALSFIFKPLFAANHRWAMSRGLESLKLELARRRARSPEEAARIPSPPAPTWPHNKRTGRD